MDITKAPKQFLDNVTGGFSEEFFVLGMLSGETGAVYALTPQHAKRLSQWLAYQVSEYETKHKPIEAQWIPGMKSPIQSTDLSIGAKPIDGKDDTDAKGKDDKPKW